VPTKEKADLYRKIGMGGIIRMDQDGKNREIFATGLRNPVGMDFTRRTRRFGATTIRLTAWATISRPAR
jgi:glucose/arabinose dehydrogenase